MTGEGPNSAYDTDATLNKQLALPEADYLSREARQAKDAIRQTLRHMQHDARQILSNSVVLRHPWVAGEAVLAVSSAVGVALACKAIRGRDARRQGHEAEPKPKGRGKGIPVTLLKLAGKAFFGALASRVVDDRVGSTNGAATEPADSYAI